MEDNFDEELFVDGKPNLKHCPFCGRPVKIHGGEEEWKPTYYDPDSGGDPYHIDCDCGCCFSGGFYEIEDIIKAWNSRHDLILCDYCAHLGENVNICLGCNNRSKFKSLD